MDTTLTAEDLIGAREAARLLLDEVGLDTYLFEVEPTEGEWTVLVEHASQGAWHRINFRAHKDELLATLDDGRRRTALARQWRKQLSERTAA